ncbi:MAG: RtcB family protein [Candidatus Promineifilaceae bacterium]
MNNELINGSDLLALGWDTGPAVGTALKAARQLLAQGVEIGRLTAQLVAVKTAPETYTSDPLWGDTADHLLKAQQRTKVIALREELAPMSIWGRKLIDDASIEQINNTARLPVTLRVALMPDAHVGYGLPIGGVAALEGAIAPYMVGVDIGCRMHATIFDRNPIHLKQKENLYKKILLENTFFGRKPIPKHRLSEHPILDDPRWQLLPRHLQTLKDTAAKQLGSSGGGNHFVEWTALTVHGNNPLGIDEGKYITLVSHSGSRAVGYKIAKHYCRMAEDMAYFLPKSLRKLGYLEYSRGEGQEYELAMNLAGDFAKACHEIIHERMAEALGGEQLGMLQNHHNFAWRVDREGKSPVFIHRKGATPASEGTLGIIPGSMAAPGFFVVGRGDSDKNILNNPSLNSAAHGSGRKMSRSQAHKKLDSKKVRELLKARGVTLIGAGLDEAPDAYKNSRDVIAAQADLVRVWAEFMPVIVRMAADSGSTLGEGQARERRDSKPWRDRKRKKRR